MDVTLDSRPRFSVIIATYNYAHFLSRVLASVFAQTYTRYEVLVIDDGSTDNTSAVLKPYLNRIVYLHQENQGQGAAHNRGINRATGEYYFFLDADDELLPDALAHFESALIENPDIPIVFGSYISVNSDGKQVLRESSTLPSDRKKALKAFLQKKAIGLKHSGAIVSRQCFARIKYPVEIRNHVDIVIFGLLLAHYPTIAIKPPIAKSHTHSERNRKNLKRVTETGISVVDAMFNPEHMPEELMSLKNLYKQQRLLSLSRTVFDAGDYQSSRQYFLRAFKINPFVLLYWKYSKRFISSWFRRNRHHAEHSAKGLNGGSGGPELS